MEFKDVVGKFCLLKKLNIYSNDYRVFEAEIVCLSDSGKYVKIRYIYSENYEWFGIKDLEIVDVVTYNYAQAY